MMDAQTVARVKELTKDPTFVAEMEDKFFEAMMRGYASEEKPKKSSLAEIPGYKVVTHVFNPWTVIDAWQVTPIGLGSGGTTHILYDEVPTWMMQYFGSYVERAIPCLKAALREAYASKTFNGGRGVRSFEHNGLIYVNGTARSTTPFDWFFGNERIYEKRFEPEMHLAEHFGMHVYHGGLMF